MMSCSQIVCEICDKPMEQWTVLWIGDEHMLACDACYLAVQPHGLRHPIKALFSTHGGCICGSGESGSNLLAWYLWHIAEIRSHSLVRG